FWNTSLYLWPLPPPKRTTARAMTTIARAAIAAIRAGVTPRACAGPFSSPKGLAATDRRSRFPRLLRGNKPPNRIRAISHHARALPGLTRSQRAATGRVHASSDVQLGQRSIQGTWQPPDPVAQQQHQRRQQDDADHGRIEQHRDGEADAELAHGGDRRAREGD